MVEDNRSPHEKAVNVSLTPPEQDREGEREKLDLPEPKAYGPVNIQEIVRPNPPEDHGPVPKMAEPGEALPGPGQTTRTVDEEEGARARGRGPGSEAGQGAGAERRGKKNPDEGVSAEAARPKRGRGGEQMQGEPKPPFPVQHQRSPGLESKMTPRPRYEGSRYKAAGKLEGKAALVTGGDSGIGRAVAVFYAKEGANVAIVYLPEEQVDAEETRRAVEAEGRMCVLLPGDLKEERFCRDAVERTVRELGGLDILVSNAAYQRSKQSIEEITAEEWDKTFRTNIYAYFYLAKAAIPHLKAGSCIIATTSENSFEPSKQLADYATTKFAINGLTKVLAQQLQGRGIRVNAVAPGPVWTPLNPSDGGRTAEKVSEFGKENPMGRPAQPEELAPAYVFLASEADSSYITGIVLPVMGGEIVAGG